MYSGEEHTLLGRSQLGDFLGDPPSGQPIISCVLVRQACGVVPQGMAVSACGRFVYVVLTRLILPVSCGWFEGSTGLTSMAAHN